MKLQFDCDLSVVKTNILINMYGESKVECYASFHTSQTTIKVSGP